MLWEGWRTKRATGHEAGEPPLILHVVPHFRPAYGFGGPSNMSSLVTSALSADGYRVVVWTTNVGDQTGRRVPSGTSLESEVTVNRYPYLSRPTFRFSNILITPGMALDALIGDLTPSVVHLHDFRSVQAVSAYILAQRLRRPLLLQPRGTLGIVGKERAKRAYDLVVGKRLLKYAYRVVALTPEEAKECLSLGVPEAKVVVVPNGVPIPDARVQSRKGNFRRRYGIDSTCFTILFMGRLRASKGVRLLLEAFEVFSLSHPGATLVLCGADEGLAPWVAERSKKRGLRVIMPGLVVGNAKTEAFVDSDVFCLPSYGEAQSVALLEAASFGLPIVASTVGTPSPFVAGGAGMFVELNSNAIAAALNDLAASEPDRHELGRRARNLVLNRYSLDSTISKLRTLYDEALEAWDA